MKWLYGVTTVPSRLGDLLPRTLASLAAAGFDKPRLFVDGADGDELYRHLGLEVTVRYPAVKTAGNWVLSVLELYLRDSLADRYALFQDDIVVCQNLRQYLERCEYPKNGYCNLCTYPANHKLCIPGYQGWYLSNQLGKGAQAMLFDREAMVRLLSETHLLRRAQDPRRGCRSIDGGVVTALKRARWQEYVHSPSLVYHTGAVSSMSSGRVQPETSSFCGEDFDALSLLPLSAATAPVVAGDGTQCLVAGAGGFIGGYLVKRLLDDGYWVRAVDIKPAEEWWQLHPGASNWFESDLRNRADCQNACESISRVYNLAADMGGIGFIETNKAACMQSVLINTHLLQAAVEHKIERYFYASSACIYHADRQSASNEAALREEDAYYGGGAMPEDGYGWEKLFSERMCRHFREDYGLQTRVARLHNIVGPHGSWTGGREKAPAAICRKIASAKQLQTTHIEVWGDGTLTRSFCWVGDCIEGIMRLTDSDHVDPLNIGSAESVTVEQLVGLIEFVAGYPVQRSYDPTKPQGVAGRSSDNTLVRRVLGWEPSTLLVTTIERTYPWIEQQVLAAMSKQRRRKA